MEDPLSLHHVFEPAVDKISDVLPQLPAKYREIFLLRDVQQLNIAECMELLGVSEEAVKVRLRRARLMVREKLAPVFRKSWLENAYSKDYSEYKSPSGVRNSLQFMRSSSQINAPSRSWVVKRGVRETAYLCRDYAIEISAA